MLLFKIHTINPSIILFLDYKFHLTGAVTSVPFFALQMADGFDEIGREELNQIPAYLKYTLLMRKYTPVERFYGSDALTKVYVSQALRQKGIDNYNAGDYSAALVALNAVR